MKTFRNFLSLFFLLFRMQYIWAQGKCCQVKTVPGLGSQSGTYNLVETSGRIPDYCNGGCVYTKEDDENPGTNYCFKDGNLDTSCSRAEGDYGGSCHGIKDWIKEFFKEECEMRVNSEMTVNVRKNYGRCGGSSSYCEYAVANATVKLYRGSDNCTGNKPYEEAMTEVEYSCAYYGTADFLISIQKSEPWSIYVEKEGYKSECVVASPRIFNSRSYYVYLEMLPKKKIQTLLLDFKFNASYELLPDVKVMSTPLSCANGSSGSGMRDHGSGYGSGSGYNNRGCNPTCEYEAWIADSSSESCDCRGVVGGGLNFTDLEFSNETKPFNSAGLEGSIFWYNEEEIDGEMEDLNEEKFFLVYGVFDRRNVTEEVCKSEMSLTLKYPDNSTDMIKRSVPCIQPQIPPTVGPATTEEPKPEPEPEPTFSTTSNSGLGSGSGYTSSNPTGSGYPSESGSGSGYPSGSGSGYPSGSGSGYPSGSGSGFPSGLPSGFFPPDMKEEYMGMFTELADGSLVFGNGDQYWFVACMKGASLSNIITLPNFFSSKSPEETPSFCGRVFAMFNETIDELAVEDVKVCYVDALLGDMMYGGYGRGDRSYSDGEKKKKSGKKHLKKHPKKHGPPPPKNFLKNYPVQNTGQVGKKHKKMKPKGKKGGHKQLEAEHQKEQNNGRQRRALEEEDIVLNSWADNDEDDDEEDEFENFFGEY